MLPLDPLRFRWPLLKLISGGTPRSSRRPNNRRPRGIEHGDWLAPETDCEEREQDKRHLLSLGGTDPVELESSPDSPPSERSAHSEHSALVDELSQFHNREGFMCASAQWLERWGRRAPWALLLSLQINHLKVIRHALGHEVSDRLLMRTAFHLREVFRQAAIIGRLGENEFAVFMRVASPYACSTLLAHLSERIDAANSTAGDLSLSVSGVVTQFDPRYAVSIRERVSQAEAAMKEAAASR